MTSPDPTQPSLGLLPTDTLIYKGTRVTLALRALTSSTGKPISREVVLHPGAVIILPVADDGRIVLIRNMRHTVNQELFELPAGTLEPKPDGTPDDPLNRARLELTEETGYTATSITPFGWFYTSPGILTEKMYAFLATGLTPGPQHLEDTEQIKVELFSPAQILSLIHENQVTDAKTIATLLKYLMGQRGG